MHVLITGAGLLGAHGARALTGRGHRVTLVDRDPNEAYIRSVTDAAIHRCDVTDLPDLRRVMGDGVDALVHTAGLIGPVAQERPFLAAMVNVGGTINVAEAARLAGVKRVVYASTHGVYDFAAADRPMTESSPTSAHSVYAATKLAAEALLEAFSTAYAMHVIALRFCNLFGRGTYVAGSRGGQAFDDLVRGAIAGATAPLGPPLLGRSEWLYAKDAATAVAAAVESDRVGGFALVNVGSGALVGPADLQAAVTAAVPGARFAAQGRPGRERAHPFDLTTADRLLGWRPSYTLAAAVADYVAEVRSR